MRLFLNTFLLSPIPEVPEACMTFFSICLPVASIICRVRDLLSSTASGRFAPSASVVIFFFCRVSVASLTSRGNYLLLFHPCQSPLVRRHCQQNIHKDIFLLTSCLIPSTAHLYPGIREMISFNKYAPAKPDRRLSR